MSEESFAQMLDNEEWKEIRTGEVVDGRVIAVKPDRIVLNIGGKSDGIITRSEYTSAPDVDLTTVVSVGDEMKAKVLKSNDGEGQVALTYRKLVADNGNKKLEDAFNNQEPITGVAKNIKGGLEVIVDEARVFIPASLVSDTYEKDLGKYQDQEIEFVISEFNPRRNRVIGDRRQLLVAEKAEKQKELFRALDLFPETDEVILSRKIVNGRGVAKVNAESVPASKMREIASILIDIHGQHDHQSLLSKKIHLEIIDDNAKEEIFDPKEKLWEANYNYRALL